MKKLLNLGLTSKIVISLILFSPSAQAQIVPDNTLPNDSTTTPQGNIQQIEGGTRAGDNLFHSFEQFSVPAEQTAAFNNAGDIANIFSRVTGNSISEVEGKIQANGAANLLLINPNGILFGENASLDIGGSFLGSTADSVIFPDGVEFSATDTQTTPLLTITAPIGLGLKSTAGDIVNRSRFASPDNIDIPVGLQVLPKKTFALVGGNILMEGGIITAESGRIEIGSVGGDNTVNLSATEPGFTLDYQGIPEFKDIDLSALALVDASGAGGSVIQIQGKQLTLTGDSAITSTTLGSAAGETMQIKAVESIEMDGDATTLSTTTEGTGKAGDLIIETGNLNVRDGAYVDTSSFAEGDGGNLTVKASESVDLIGTTSDISDSSGLFAEVGEDSTGNGGDITIETKNLTVSDGAVVSASTLGVGEGGDLVVQATESVEIMGTSADEAFPSSLFADANDTGNGGNLTITTQNLTVQDGAQVTVDTFGAGNAGNLTVQASDSVELSGRNSDGLNPSGLFSQVNPSASGNAGNLSLETKQLIVQDGAQISTTAGNEGQAGDLMINAENLILLSGTSSLGDAFSSSGVFISAEPGSSGNAGELTINTGELTVEKGAKISADNFGTGEGANVSLNLDRLIINEGGIIGAGSLLQPIGSTDENISNQVRGSGGNLTVNATEAITITGTGNIGDTLVDSSLFTEAEGTGDAGNLTINTPNLTVADQGNINVSVTGTGGAGSLSIDAQELNLDNGSLTAETRVGDEGNITLSNADGLLLRNNSQITTNATEQATGGDITISSEAIALLDGSNITANAVEGRGGNIDITTQGIFQEPDSAITASSQLGIDGTITINSLDVDPTSGIYKLPDAPIDAENILAQDLCKLEDEKIAKGSSFIITGRGGLTPTAADSLGDVDNVVNWANREDLEVSQNGAVGIRQREANSSEKDSANKSYPDLKQSQGLVVAKDGSAWLTANAYSTASNNSGITHPDCGQK
jgi:filamentous hemagglutinin family protein